MPLKYLSLFSGIGGFEIAIHNVFPDAICIGYSEVDKYAIKVYQYRFPKHRNLGDITNITEVQIKTLVEKYGGCDLVVGGFPCTNLSSLATCYNRDSRGLEGAKSSLFFKMMLILSWVGKPIPKVVIENNMSMTNHNKEKITRFLQQWDPSIIMNTIDSRYFVLQSRKRIYWTNFTISEYSRVEHTNWDDILLNIEFPYRHFTAQRQITYNKIIQQTKSKTLTRIAKPNNVNKLTTFILVESYGKSKWGGGFYSIAYKRCIPIFRTENFLMDTRHGNDNECMIRFWEVIEAERLFGVPDGWVGELCTPTRSFKLLGNTIVVPVCQHIIESLKVFY